MNSRTLILFMLTVAFAIATLVHETSASPTLVPYIETQLPNGYIQRDIRMGGAGWWRDDAGIIHETVSELTQSDGVWDIQNISAPHKVYAATDEVRWRVDPPAGEAAGFEIAFSTVSLYLFDEGGDVEKTIPWTRLPLSTQYSDTTITYPLFDSATLYVLSTPEGYKTNFYISNPGNIPDPQGNDYFGVSSDLSKVYVAVRYSVSKWPDSPMLVDGEPFGPGSITDGYSATFGDDLWMLPTKAYRNVQGFNGESWTKHEDESYVYYVFDRLAQEILVLAPYTLFVGAQNVVIDPTTWTSGQTSSDDAAFFASETATTNYGSSATIGIGEQGAASQYRSMAIRFASVPSHAVVQDVSANILLTFSSTGAGTGLTAIVAAARAARDWVEAQVTWNVFKTANNWTTAGARSSSSDYEDGATYSPPQDASWNIGGANINTIVEGWIEGTRTNNGFILTYDTNPNNGYKYYHSDDAASAANRPLLTVVYTVVSTLPTLPADTTYVGVEAGSVLSYIVVDATTAYMDVASIANDVTADIVLDTGTQLLIGNGAGADDNWDTQAAADLVGGGSMFVLASDYALSDAAGVALYFESSLTGATETRYYGLSPSGGGSVDLSAVAKTTQLTAVHDAIQSVTTNGTWGLPAISTLVSGASAALTDWTRYQPQSTKYPIVCYPTASDIGTLFVPEGVYLQEDASLELLASFSADAATPDMEISVRNDAGNALISFNARDAYHAGSWSFTRESLAQIDSTTRYIFRMRYEIPSSALTASGTGALHVIGTYRNPMYGTKDINNTVAMYSKQLEGSELDAVNASIAAVDVSLTSLDTEINKINPSSTVIYMASGVEIRGATWTGTRYEAAPGYCNVVTGCPAVIQKTMDDGTKWNLFLHYEETNLNVPVPVAFVEDGAWTVSAGKVTAANATDAVKATGQSEDVLWYTEVSGF